MSRSTCGRCARQQGVTCRPRWVMSLLAILIALAIVAPRDAFSQDIEQGKIKSLDVAKKTLVVTVAGKDRELALSEQTHVLDARGESLAEKLAEFKVGADIFFRAAPRDGHEVAMGLKLMRAGETAPGGGAAGQGNRNRGKVKKVDVEGKVVTITVGKEDQELSLTEQTQLRGGSGKTLAEQLKAFPEGAEVVFATRERDGKKILEGMMLMQGPAGAPGKPTSPDHADFKPLTELGAGKYKEFPGGLYPEGKNDRPAAHEAAGLRLASQVRPLDADGKPADDGKIVLLSVGMSNTAQISEGLMRLLPAAKGLNPKFAFVNGAQGGMTAEAIQDPNDEGRGAQYWRVVDERLKQANATRQQVQAVWIKQADAGPRQGFPDYPRKLQGELKRIVHVIAERFPNARLCYLSSRTYGGYATTMLNPEPVAYESGFAVKWLIEEQLRGDAELNYDAAKGAMKSPWLSWGPYLWANGATKRADGFSYDPADFGPDGTHHGPAGMKKTAELLLKFLENDATTKPWMVQAADK